MIPAWVYLVLTVVLLVVPPLVQCRQINRRRDNARANNRAIEAEYIARANGAPLGNADRVYDRKN